MLVDVEAPVVVRVAAPLRLFLPLRLRSGAGASVAHDPTASVGHVVTSLGVPLTEVERCLVNGVRVEPTARLDPGDVVDVEMRRRPQPVPTDPPRFVLDVHLGSLARRLRLLGLDTAYRNDADDEELVAQSLLEDRILLTQDRGLLRRGALHSAAYVRGQRADDQLADVLDRFRPQLAPWSRCTACNGWLRPVAKRDVEHLLEPGTRRSYDEFARCEQCGRVYWPGAHHARLAAVVSNVTS